MKVVLDAAPQGDRSKYPIQQDSIDFPSLKAEVQTKVAYLCRGRDDDMTDEDEYCPCMQTPTQTHGAFACVFAHKGQHEMRAMTREPLQHEGDGDGKTRTMKTSHWGERTGGRTRTGTWMRTVAAVRSSLFSSRSEGTTVDG